MKSFNAGFLRSTPALILSAFLLLQAITVYSCARSEVLPNNRPLAELPRQLGAWRFYEEGVIEQEVQDQLQADELLNRSYVISNSGGGRAANLFVAYFRSQRTGRGPHSPRNCLPGSGWTPLVSDTLSIPVSGRNPIEVNRYIVQRGGVKSLVFYWYQSRDRTVASEYAAKFYVVADAIRYNRTDTALVRVVVPIVNDDADAAQGVATDFVRSFFVPLRQHFPA
jgi:EpsI family protein